MLSSYLASLVLSRLVCIVLYYVAYPETQIHNTITNNSEAHVHARTFPCPMSSSKLPVRQISRSCLD